MNSDRNEDMATVENVIIIGSGPAGYTAALYTARANLEPLVIEGFLWGGLLQQTTDVENYPGFAEGIMGPELMTRMRDQAERFGARYITDQATEVRLANEPGGIHTVVVGGEELQARTVVLAMGAEHKKLGVPVPVLPPPCPASITILCTASGKTAASTGWRGEASTGMVAGNARRLRGGDSGPHAPEQPPSGAPSRRTGVRRSAATSRTGRTRAEPPPGPARPSGQRRLRRSVFGNRPSARSTFCCTRSRRSWRLMRSTFAISDS